MRTVPSGFYASSTRCFIALVVRQDGTKLGLTDHDQSFNWNNNGFGYSGSGVVAYKSTCGIDATNAQTEAGTSPGSIEIKTIESAIASQITARDLMAGFYEGARVWVYEIDYMNLTAGRAVIVGQYVFSKFTIRDSHVEISLAETFFLLRQNTGKILCSGCQANRYGDKDCDPSQTIRARDSNALAVVSAVIDCMTLEFSGDSAVVNFYDFGELIFTSGVLLPAPAFDIKRHSIPSAGVCMVKLRDPLIIMPSVGDTATLVRGCDRHFATCQGIANSHNPSGTNIENFHGVILPLPDEYAVVGDQPGS